MIVIYVVGAYRAPTIRGVVENIRSAESVALSLWQRGFAVVCPHLNSALLDGAVPDGTFLAGDLEILSRCDAVVTVPGWEASVGSVAEVQEAKSLGLAVFHWEPNRASERLPLDEFRETFG